MHSFGINRLNQLSILNLPGNKAISNLNECLQVIKELISMHNFEQLLPLLAILVTAVRYIDCRRFEFAEVTAHPTTTATTTTDAECVDQGVH